mmetsp:Transcript_21717/g.68068  ORF Transcript_21717/g.68068 Transcript_21717/m.68068 type:complete len:155 (-) Transcript_21717:20-484(-)
MVARERAGAFSFDAVVKLRADDHWLGPAPPWCALEGLWTGDAAYADLAGSDDEGYPGGLDWWLAAPRRAAAEIFLQAERYLNCSRSHPKHSEKWLQATLRRARLQVRRLKHMPRVIVYENNREARKFCGYVPEYQRAACDRLRYPRERRGESRG